MFNEDDAGRSLFHYTRGETFMTHILPLATEELAVASPMRWVERSMS
jgi:hypothetical protein